MKSFIQFVQEEFQRLKQKRERTEFIKSLPKSFREYVLESFDSSYEIQSTQQNGSVELFHFKINKESYRIFIEKSAYYSNINKEVQIGFEWFDGTKYTSEGLIGKLSTKEVMGLFGTVKKIIQNKKFDRIYIGTNNVDKFRLYLKICTKLSAELKYNFTSYKEGEMGYIEIHNELKSTSPYKKFKIKFK